jgi:hypothetical protein
MRHQTGSVVTLVVTQDLMDTQKALEEVQAFFLDIVEYERELETDRVTPNLRTRIAQRLTLITDIAEASSLHDADRIRLWDSYMRSSLARTAVEELSGILQGEDRRTQIFGLKGPKLQAARMHRWVWQAAAELWDGGHMREAVQAAATSVFDQQLPAKLGASKGDKPADLVSQAFSIDPPTPDKPRLRLPGFTKGDNDWKSAHEGAKFFGMGCAKAIRNVVSHTTDQPDEDEALESLAALSLLSRWIDDAVVEKAKGHV